MRDKDLLTDSYDKVYYAVIVEGKTIYTTGVESSAHTFRDNLPASVREKATVQSTTIDGKQILFD